MWTNTIDQYIEQQSANKANTWLRNQLTVDWVSVEYRLKVNQVLLEHLSICQLLLNWHFTDTHEPMYGPRLDWYPTNTQLSVIYGSCISWQLWDAMPALGRHIDWVSADRIGRRYVQWTWSSKCYSLSILLKTVSSQAECSRKKVAVTSLHFHVCEEHLDKVWMNCWLNILNQLDFSFNFYTSSDLNRIL